MCVAAGPTIRDTVLGTSVFFGLIITVIILSGFFYCCKRRKKTVVIERPKSHSPPPPTHLPYIMRAATPIPNETLPRAELYPPATPKYMSLEKKSFTSSPHLQYHPSSPHPSWAPYPSYQHSTLPRHQAPPPASPHPPSFMSCREKPLLWYSYSTKLP